MEDESTAIGFSYQTASQGRIGSRLLSPAGYAVQSRHTWQDLVSHLRICSADNSMLMQWLRALGAVSH